MAEFKKVGLNFYKRGSVYYSRFRHGGKIYSKAVGTDHAMAKRRAADHVRETRFARPDAIGRTMEQHAAIFIPLMDGKAGTLKQKKMYLERMLAEWSKTAPAVMSKVLPSHLKAYLSQYADHPPTANKILTIAKKFFELAVEDRVIEFSPAASIKRFKVTSPKRPTPTLEQVHALVDEVRRNGVPETAETFADFVLLTAMLGLGQAELGALRRQDIDLEAGEIRVVRMKTGAPYTIPIFPNAEDTLRRRVAVIGDDPDTLLFGKLNPYHWLVRACKALGYPFFEPRSLRRFHITRCLRAGIDVGMIAKWQAHGDGGALILKTYAAEISQQSSAKAARRLV